MGFGESFAHNLTKPFEGRASRSEYWWFFLWYFLLFAVPYVILIASVGISMPSFGDQAAVNMLAGVGMVMVPIFMAWYFLVLWVALASVCTAIRRLHDKDKSGWWIFAFMIPVIGWILWVIWFSQRGTEGPNRFGPDPLAGTNPEVFA